MGSANNCRACGYDWGEPPWGASGQEPSFWICPCCEVEAGYEDASPEGARRYREEWLAQGAPWSDPDEPHDGLSTEERLTHVPPGFE
jgi:hypothetical protein